MSRRRGKSRRESAIRREIAVHGADGVVERVVLAIIKWLNDVSDDSVVCIEKMLEGGVISVQFKEAGSDEHIAAVDVLADTNEVAWLSLKCSHGLLMWGYISRRTEFGVPIVTKRWIHVSGGKVEEVSLGEELDGIIRKLLDAFTSGRTLSRCVSQINI